jgi:YARHG domain-containing protein
MKALPLAVVLCLALGGIASAQISATLEQPQCYENVGCPHKDRITEAQTRGMSCENLRLVRNTIYHQRGFCFQTKRRQAEFDSSRCTVKTLAGLQLSEVEQANIATLEGIERRKRCR